MIKDKNPMAIFTNINDFYDVRKLDYQEMATDNDQ